MTAKSGGTKLNEKYTILEENTEETSFLSRPSISSCDESRLRSLMKRNAKDNLKGTL